MMHGSKGYQLGCRCPLCTGMQNYRISQQRSNRKGVSHEPTPYNMACLDLTVILRSLARDTGFTSGIEEGVMGECAALRNLIDTCNYDGRLPRIQYWMSRGTMQVGGMR